MSTFVPVISLLFSSFSIDPIIATSCKGAVCMLYCPDYTIINTELWFLDKSLQQKLHLENRERNISRQDYLSLLHLECIKCMV